MGDISDRLEAARDFYTFGEDLCEHFLGAEVLIIELDRVVEMDLVHIRVIFLFEEALEIRASPESFLHYYQFVRVRLAALDIMAGSKLRFHNYVISELLLEERYFLDRHLDGRDFQLLVKQSLVNCI